MNRRLSIFFRNDALKAHAETLKPNNEQFLKKSVK